MTNEIYIYTLFLAALIEAKERLLDKATIYADNKSFNEIINWMDIEPSADEIERMNRLIY